MLTSVSETALITLKSRIQETKYINPVIVDPVGELCYNAILAKVHKDIKTRILKRTLPRALTSYVALRARKFDEYTRTFIRKHPDGLIVNLGCGFDTRYWRTELGKDQYIELDLPSIIDIKKEILGDEIDYCLLGQSVLEREWIKKVKSIQDHHVLFLAEGLLMYLPENKVIELFHTLAENFSESEFAFEVVNKKYTKGFNKKMVEMKMKRQLGNDAGSSYNFGIIGPEEIEAYHKNLKVIDEWSYFEDDLIKPGILKFFRHFKMFTRTQWTMKVTINQSE